MPQPDSGRGECEPVKGGGSSRSSEELLRHSEQGMVELAEAWFQLNCPSERWETIKIMFDQYRNGTLSEENRHNFLRLCSICLLHGEQ